jgi:hypothetical protein
VTRDGSTSSPVSRAVSHPSPRLPRSGRVKERALAVIEPVGQTVDRREQQRGDDYGGDH